MSVTEIIRENFKKKKVVIVGDLVADQFLHGTIARVSREAPVFILRHDETNTLPGGAANAAMNTAALGAETVVIGIVGDDEAGRSLQTKLSDGGVDCSGIVTNPDMKTTTKVRVLGGQEHAVRQQVIRIDYENGNLPDESTISKIVGKLAAYGKDADAIIISDYDYGAADARVFEKALEISREQGIPVVVDSRFALTRFKGASAATPNEDEAVKLLGGRFSEEGCENLREELEVQSLLVTRGNKGMVLFEKGSAPKVVDAIGSKEPVDVTGAGDTVIAAFTLGLASGMGSLEAMKVANHAGGIVVMKKGTATVSLDELLGSVAEGLR
jgi:rfaE bifunctional protein kinase chain/domain